MADGLPGENLQGHDPKGSPTPGGRWVTNAADVCWGATFRTRMERVEWQASNAIRSNGRHRMESNGRQAAAERIWQSDKPLKPKVRSRDGGRASRRQLRGDQRRSHLLWRGFLVRHPRILPALPPTPILVRMPTKPFLPREILQRYLAHRKTQPPRTLP